MLRLPVKIPLVWSVIASAVLWLVIIAELTLII